MFHHHPDNAPSDRPCTIYLSMSRNHSPAALQILAALLRQILFRHYNAPRSYVCFPKPPMHKGTALSSALHSWWNTDRLHNAYGFHPLRLYRSGCRAGYHAPVHLLHVYNAHRSLPLKEYQALCSWKGAPHWLSAALECHDPAAPENSCPFRNSPDIWVPPALPLRSYPFLCIAALRPPDRLTGQ